MDVEKIERELVKKALTQKLYFAQLQVLQNSCFWKKLFGGLLDNSFNEVAPELCTFSLINVLRTNNSFFQPQLPNLNFLTRVTSNFIEIFFFWKNWYYASLESAKHVLSEYAIKCYFAVFIRASFRENWMWIKKKCPTPTFCHGSTPIFSKLSSTLGHWKAPSKCFATS